MENKEIFQYVPFKSCINPTFWYKLAEIKVDIDCLNDKPRSIYGFYTNLNTIDCLLEVDCTSFNEDFNPPKNNFVSQGILLNKNTIEEFKNCDKTKIIDDIGKIIQDNILNGNAIKDPSLLSNFVILSFADLKKHNYYYWFGFPAPSNTIAFNTIGSLCQKITEKFNTEQLQELQQQYFGISDSQNKGFFLLEKTNDSLCIKLLSEKINHIETKNNCINDNLSNIYFCYSDPCEFENAGWILRNYISFLVQLCPLLHSKTLNIISIRNKGLQCLDSSIFYEIYIPPAEDIKFDNMKWIGWELNDNGKMGPRMSAMGASMDPIQLAASSVNLNLKLMKWRLLPELDLEIISKTKCLLFGAGTLGCGVARTLISWGVENITFIDYGTVSYSNPVRQNLYTHADAIGGGKKKALIAAERVKDVHPGIKSKGYSMMIPMAGHPVGESMFNKTIENINLIKELISTHDVLFLLTDSRESRWLPTLLGAHYDKIVMNAALGFDSYLVMRHGCRKTVTENINVEIPGLKCIPGNQLGCYFCNDITAPGNSLKDRTLDQQCTVTRPAVSNIASSLVVELMISLLQHKEKNLAPAYSSLSLNTNDIEIPEGILGILPHSIRGQLGTYEQILPATENFHQCIACSDKILTEYRKRGNEFILQVLESSKYLEDLTGLSEMMSMENDIIACDDDFEVSD